MSKPAMDLETFLKDVANHQMEIKVDNGLYRHLVFRGSKDSWNQWFEIITWPMGLIIDGDMGCWAFRRIEDMFKFFRSKDLKINPSYWGEKIQGESRFGGPYQKFDVETYTENVLDSLDGHGLIEEEKAKAAEALRDDVFSGFDENDEAGAHRAVAEFEMDLVCYSREHPFSLSDPWEINGKKYTLHYLWCLFAIVWGINAYDAAREKKA